MTNRIWLVCEALQYGDAAEVVSASTRELIRGMVDVLD